MTDTAGRPRTRRVLDAIGPRNLSAVYLFILMFLLFSIWVPDTFLTVGVWRSLLDNQALTALAAIAVVVPMAAGVFNLAVGAQIGFGSIVVAALIHSLGLPPLMASLLTIVAGTMTGVVIALLVVKARIESIIATLGMSSVLLALTAWVSDSRQILDLGLDFQQFAVARIGGITASTWLMLIVAIICWYVLECTPAGRRVYATGGNKRAAEFAGVRTTPVIVACLAAGGAIAGLTGVLASARTGTGDPTLGPGFLLPAFAAAMLGSTQIKRGRYNIWGTVIAVYVLATGITGLRLAGAPVWIPDLFNGVALLVAVAVTARQRRPKARRAPETPAAPTSGPVSSPAPPELTETKGGR